MKRKCKLIMVVQIVTCIFIFQSPAQKDVVWAPLLDQDAMQKWGTKFYYSEPTPNNPLGIVDLPTGTTLAQLRNTIDRSIEIARQKGITVIDIAYNGDYTFSPNTEECYAFSNAHILKGNLWLERINLYNINHLSSRFRVRVRVRASRSYYEWLRSRRVGAAEQASRELSQRADNNRPKIERYVINGTTIDSSTIQLQPAQDYLNISDAIIRSDIGTYVGWVLAELNSKLNSFSGNGRLVSSDIQEVTLSLDAGGETSIWGVEDTSINETLIILTPNCRVYFSNKKFEDMTYSEKINHFRSRQQYLNATYRIFANAVKSHFPNAKPAVFHQIWVFDDISRGAYDLYGLLANTGIEKVHVTLLADSDFNENISGSNNKLEYYKIFAFYDKTCDLLDIDYDLEFTWAHYNQGGPFVNPFDPSKFNPIYAERFYNQARAGFKYGATGMVYCNWTMSTIRMEHPLLTTENSFGTPEQWRKIIGDNSSSLCFYKKQISTGDMFKFLYPPPIPIHFNNDHLGCISGNRPWVPSYNDSAYIYKTYPDTNLKTSEGLLTSSSTTELGTAQKAIYISSYGRINASTLSSGDSAFIVLYLTYLHWFDEFNLTNEINKYGPNGKKVDIITDGIIRNHPNWYTQYTHIYMPYHTSKAIGNIAFGKLLSLPEEVRNNRLFIQNTAGGSASASANSFTGWRNSVKVISEPESITPIMQLLLDD